MLTTLCELIYINPFLCCSDATHTRKIKMDLIPNYNSSERYWRRRGYQKLNDARKKNVTVIRSKGPSSSSSSKRWRIGGAKLCQSYASTLSLLHRCGFGPSSGMLTFERWAIWQAKLVLWIMRVLLEPSGFQIKQGKVLELFILVKKLNFYARSSMAN